MSNYKKDKTKVKGATISIRITTDSHYKLHRLCAILKCNQSEAIRKLIEHGYADMATTNLFKDAH